MNVTLWILQILLAVHTLIGAIWKWSHSEKAVPSLGTIPQGVWQGLSVIEILCALVLIIPFLSRSLAMLVPFAAALIAAEMLFFCLVHFYAGGTEHNQVVYWLVVAAISAFIAYGRFALHPLLSSAGTTSP